MSLTINYDSNFSSFNYNGESGLAAYMAYFQDSYSSAGHAADLGFHNSPGSLEVGSTTYADSFFGTQLIGEEMSNTSTTVDNVSFVIDGGEVTLEDSNGDAYSEEVAMYTLFSNPAHTLAAEIESLTFGDGAYSGGSLASELFTITGLDEAISSGFLDNDSDGAYDALEQGEAHDLIYDLMGGMGGAGGASVLEGILNDFDIVHEGTSSNETFDVFSGVDTINLGGGDDVVNAGFSVGSGGDVIDLSDMSHYFTDAADAATQVIYDEDSGNAYLDYYDGVDLYSVEIIGVSSGLTADNFVV